MGTQHSESTRGKTLGIVLIVIVGLLNFHLPHFLLESATPAGDTAYLELVFVANLLCATTAAVAIWRNRRPWAARGVDKIGVAKEALARRVSGRRGRIAR